MRASANIPRVCSTDNNEQGGGFSPKRLRAMLLGVDKRRKGQDDDADEDYDAVPKASVRSDADARGEQFLLHFFALV